MFVPPPRRRGDLQLGLLIELAARWARRDLLRIRISGEEMLPALRPDDVLLCSRTHRPWLGAIVVEEEAFPRGRLAPRVRRITGLAGDLSGSVRVQPGYLWLESDNRETSQDSQGSSPAPVGQLRGVAIALLRGNELHDLRFRVHASGIGLRRFLAVWPNRMHDAWRDWTRGVSTRGFVRADAFGFSPTRVFAYSATPWDVAREALDSIEISGTDVFVDYGCGKGRVLAVALEYPFRRLLGIELVPELARIGRRNLARDAKRCEIVEADASSLPLPDDATVIFLFNPFGREVLPEVLARIRESAARRPRRIRVLTYGMQSADLAPLLRQDPRQLNDRLLQLYVLQPGPSSGDP